MHDDGESSSRTSTRLEELQIAFLIGCHCRCVYARPTTVDRLESKIAGPGRRKIELDETRENLDIHLSGSRVNHVYGQYVSSMNRSFCPLVNVDVRN